MFVPEEERLVANSEFEANSPMFLFCKSEADYDGVLAKQGPRCGATECQKFSTLPNPWCQEHEAEMRTEEVEERTNEAKVLGGVEGEDDDMPAAEAIMHADSLALIRKMQNSVEPILPFKAVAALVVALGAGMWNHLQFEPAGICLLLQLLEHYLFGLLEDSNLLSIHDDRRRVIAQDVYLARRIRGERS
jgi:histone H3/H4